MAAWKNFKGSMNEKLNLRKKIVHIYHGNKRLDGCYKGSPLLCRKKFKINKAIEVYIDKA